MMNLPNPQKIDLKLSSTPLILGELISLTYASEVITNHEHGTKAVRNPVISIGKFDAFAINIHPIDHGNIPSLSVFNLPKWSITNPARTLLIGFTSVKPLNNHDNSLSDIVNESSTCVLLFLEK
uniref:Uncharacterized protein n=1 Tax=Photinus pyralis TaxID=7054 RepID=A0A1Y1KM78_PHOPY